MLLREYTLPEVRQRRGRALLTLLGIALGVAIFVAATAVTGSADRACRDLFDGVSGPGTLEIVTPDLTGFDPDLAAGLPRLPGVGAVVPRIVTSAALMTPGGGVPVLVLGLERAASLPLSGLDLTAGQPIADGPGVLLDERHAAEYGLPPGTTVRLWAPGGLTELPVCGLLRARGPLALGGVPVLCLPLPLAQRLFQLPGRVNSVAVIPASAADPGTLLASLREHVPGGLIVQSPGSRAETAAGTLQAAQQGLNALALIAPAMAAFVMLNTFLLNLGERRRRLALLHVLGATRGQVRRLLLVEGFLFGLAGGLLGLGGGIVLGRVLAGLVGRCWGVQLSPAAVSVPLAVTGVLAGPALAVAAALVALCQSGRLAPLEALQGRGPGGVERSRRGRPLGGLLLAGVALGLLALLGRRGISVATARALLGPAVVAWLVGCALALPLLTTAALAVARRGLRGWLSPVAEVALHQLGRRLPRTHLTTGVFFMATATAVAFGHSLGNTLEDLQRWCRRAIVADYLVRGSMPDSGFLLTAALPEQLAADLGGLDGVQRIDFISFLPGRANGQPVLLLARTFPAGVELPLDLAEGDRDRVGRNLHDGQVAIGAALGRRLGLGVGDWLTLDGAAGPARLRIAATVVEYAAGGQAIYLDWSAAKGLLQVPGVHAFLVTLRPGCSAAAQVALRESCTRRGLLLQSNAELRAFIERLLARVAALLRVLIVLALVIAALGIANTLSMNVLEQARDAAVLRALGMTRWQLCGCLLYQGALLVTLSALPAAVAGVALAYLLNGACGQLCGQRVAFHVLPAQAAACVGLAYLVGLLASVVPARRLLRSAGGRPFRL
jgi:putative ABC transport system permease protein